MIDGDVEVTVLEVAGEKVRIGVEAPDDVEVHRKEVANRIDSEREDGSQAGT